MAKALNKHMRASSQFDAYALAEQQYLASGLPLACGFLQGTVGVLHVLDNDDGLEEDLRPVCAFFLSRAFWWSLDAAGTV